MKYQLCRRDRHKSLTSIGEWGSLADAQHSQEMAMKAARETGERVSVFVIINEDKEEIT